MNSTFTVFKASSIMLLFISIMMAPGSVCAQEVQLATPKRDTLLSVAREYMQAVRYCALITVDSTGQPHVRAMDPFLPDENMVVWFGTNRKSRKVQEIRKNPRVTLYYSDDKGAGYVAIIGTARLVDDPKEKAVRWKEEWVEFYKDQKESYLLIKVIPEKLEIVNYKHGIVGDTETWRSPSVEFRVHEPKD
ncbi:MAG: pyridoxamine 5'-phosphate oxidase family protein [bacterium]